MDACEFLDQIKNDLKKVQDRVIVEQVSTYHIKSRKFYRKSVSNSDCIASLSYYKNNVYRSILLPSNIHKIIHKTLKYITLNKVSHVIRNNKRSNTIFSDAQSYKKIKKPNQSMAINNCEILKDLVLIMMRNFKFIYQLLQRTVDESLLLIKLIDGTNNYNEEDSINEQNKQYLLEKIEISELRKFFKVALWIARDLVLLEQYQLINSNKIYNLVDIHEKSRLEIFQRKITILEEIMKFMKKIKHEGFEGRTSAQRLVQIETRSLLMSNFLRTEKYEKSLIEGNNAIIEILPILTILFQKGKGNLKNREVNILKKRYTRLFFLNCIFVFCAHIGNGQISIVKQLLGVIKDISVLPGARQFENHFPAFSTIILSANNIYYQYLEIKQIVQLFSLKKEEINVYINIKTLKANTRVSQNNQQNNIEDQMRLTDKKNKKSYRNQKSVTFNQNIYDNREITKKRRNANIGYFCSQENLSKSQINTMYSIDHRIKCKNFKIDGSFNFISNKDNPMKMGFHSNRWQKSEDFKREEFKLIDQINNEHLVEVDKKVRKSLNLYKTEDLEAQKIYNDRKNRQSQNLQLNLESIKKQQQLQNIKIQSRKQQVKLKKSINPTYYLNNCMNRWSDTTAIKPNNYQIDLYSWKIHRHQMHNKHIKTVLNSGNDPQSKTLKTNRQKKMYLKDKMGSDNVKQKFLKLLIHNKDSLNISEYINMIESFFQKSQIDNQKKFKRTKKADQNIQSIQKRINTKKDSLAINLQKAQGNRSLKKIRSMIFKSHSNHNVDQNQVINTKHSLCQQNSDKELEQIKSNKSYISQKKLTSMHTLNQPENKNMNVKLREFYEEGTQNRLENYYLNDCHFRKSAESIDNIAKRLRKQMNDKKYKVPRKLINFKQYNSNAANILTMTAKTKLI